MNKHVQAVGNVLGGIIAFAFLGGLIFLGIRYGYQVEELLNKIMGHIVIISIALTVILVSLALLVYAFKTLVKALHGERRD